MSGFIQELCALAEGWREQAKRASDRREESAIEVCADDLEALIARYINAAQIIGSDLAGLTVTVSGGSGPQSSEESSSTERKTLPASYICGPEI